MPGPPIKRMITAAHWEDRSGSQRFTTAAIRPFSFFPGSNLATNWARRTQVPFPLTPCAAKNLLPFWPEPTNKTAQFNNFTLASTIPINNTATTIRIDHSFSEGSKIFGSYNSRENNRTSGGNPILPDPVDPITWKQDFTTHFFRLGWDYIFSPTLLNHLTFGSNRSNS